MTIVVTELAVAPVKGMRPVAPPEVRLGRYGPDADRDFVVVSADNALLLTQRTPALLNIEPSWQPERELLTLRFPDGRAVRDTPSYGERVVTAMYDGRPMSGRVVTGPLADALSYFLGTRVRLLRRDPDQVGADDYPVTLMSTGSLGVVADVLAMPGLDPRRFRMTVTVEGVQPWEENRWSGGRVGVGEAVLQVASPVQRCVVTTRNPRTGAGDAKVLHALATLRGRKDITFGIWCSVLHPGRVRRGDPVTPL